MGRICITYLPEPETDRWIPGDRWVRPLVRRIVRGKPRPGGLDKVYINLCLGLDRLKIPYEANTPYGRLRHDDMVGVLGRGRHCLDGYRRREPLVAGIGLMTHPSEWPTLFEDYPVACYLQHSEWSAAIYRRHYGDRCPIWPVGIDTEAWRLTGSLKEKPNDFLIYNKSRWDRAHFESELLNPILAALDRAGMTGLRMEYGQYSPDGYKKALATCKAAIFLSSHESQGIACQEAMAAGVPIFAWDPGRNLDPERFKWGEPEIPACSIPYFDERCGMSFTDFASFERNLPLFAESLRAGAFAPRDYILENLTVEKCSQHFVDILKERLR
jgi:hypothetical protein